MLINDIMIIPCKDGRCGSYVASQFYEKLGIKNTSHHISQTLERSIKVSHSGSFFNADKIFIDGSNTVSEF